MTRILVIDDQESIHADFRRVLGEESSPALDELDELEAEMFQTERPERARLPEFRVDSALQGEEGFRQVSGAVREGQPYAVAFVDMRMPPGWDGIETIEHLWKADSDLEIVICTAYSDYTWAQMVQRLGVTDKLLVLKKPFDQTEVRQLVASLSTKRALLQQTRATMQELVDTCTQLQKANVALETNARLMAEVQAEREQRQLAEALRAVNLRLTFRLTSAEVLSCFLECLGEVVDFESGGAWLMAEDGLKKVAGVGECELDNPFESARPGELLAGEGWMIIPIWRGETPLAAFALAGGKGFGPRQLEIGAAFASQAFIALENVRLFEEVRALASTDELTGLANRRHFFELAERELSRVRRYKLPLSVIMLDVDHFKACNDTHGHQVGDAVLREVARRLRGALRTTDLIGRYGGEEFVVLLIQTELKDAEIVAERLRKAVAETPIETDSGPLPITISLGITGFRNELSRMLSAADQALYEAKAAGRNRVVTVACPS